MTTPQLRQHIGLEAQKLLEDIADVYDEVYAEPPYNSGPLFARDEFLKRTDAQIPASGFKLVTAKADEALAGFAFGFSLGARWWGGETSELEPDVTNASKYAVIELVVRQPFRGSGLGRSLLNELLAGRPEILATLLSVPEAPAHSLYERWDWRKVGTVQPTPYAPVMDAMVLDLVGFKP